MGDLGHHAGLALEPPPALVVLSELGIDQFQRGLLLERHVFNEPDLTHSTFSQLLLEQVFAEHRLPLLDRRRWQHVPFVGPVLAWSGGDFLRISRLFLDGRRRGWGRCFRGRNRVANRCWLGLGSLQSRLLDSRQIFGGKCGRTLHGLVPRAVVEVVWMRTFVACHLGFLPVKTIQRHSKTWRPVNKPAQFASATETGFIVRLSPVCGEAVQERNFSWP